MSALRLPNGRDLGGRRASDGRLVRTGVAYRAAALADPDLVPIVASLGVRHVFDLRTVTEREQRPDVLPDDARLVLADMLADDPSAGPASLGQIARSALAGDTRALSAPELKTTFEEGYRSFVTLDSSRRVSREILLQAADGGDDGGRGDGGGDGGGGDGAILFHCTAGKDRTGWLAALILMAVGADWEDIVEDYLASGPAVAAMFAPYRDLFAQRGGDLAAMDVAIGVSADYLEAARSELEGRYGDIDGYLLTGLGLPAGFRDRLATRLLLDD